MGIVINQLMALNDLDYYVRVNWRERPTTKSEGVYIVSLSDDPNANNGKCKHAPISKDLIDKWIYKVNGFEIDKQMTFDSDIVIERLSKFWLPDENILYMNLVQVNLESLQSGFDLENCQMVDSMTRVNELVNTIDGTPCSH